MMGSIDGYAKSRQPMLDRIRQHNDEHNRRVDGIARSAPLWRKLLFLIGLRRQFYRWEHRQ